MGGVCAALWFCAGCWRSIGSATPRCNSRTNTKCTHTNAATADRQGAVHSQLSSNATYVGSCFVITPPPPTPHNTLHRHIWVGAPPPTNPLLFFLCAGWRVQAGGSYPDQFNSCRQAVSQSSCAPTIVFLSFRPLLGDDDDTYCIVCCTVRVQIVCIIMCGVNSCAKLLIHT
jgi:hypothetical protein